MRNDASDKLLSSRLPAALAVFKKSPLFKLRGAKTRSRVVETGKQPHSPKLLSVTEVNLHVCCTGISPCHPVLQLKTGPTREEATLRWLWHWQ